MTNPMPPGWYDDPDGSPNAERRWDGHSWTPERRRKAMPAAAPSYPRPAPPTMPPPPYPQGAQSPPLYQPAPPPPYPQPAPPLYSPLGPNQPYQTAASNVFSIAAFVAAGLALLGGVVITIAPLPFVFGVVAIICAVVALTKKERLAPFAIGAAIGGLILGWILQAVFWNSLFL